MSWPTAQLGNVCEIVSGATPKTGTAEYWDGDVAWATPKDLSDLGGKHLTDTPRKLTRLGHESCSAAILPPQSVLLSSRAPIGLVAINTIPLCTNQGFKNLVPRNGSVSADYLYWWLRCNNAFLQSLGRGATFKEVSKAIVSRIEIPLPPLAEQKRIAAILDAADALRAKRREALAQLDTLLQATFLDLFGDPVTNPKGWPTATIGDVCAVTKLAGFEYTKYFRYLAKGEVTVVRALNVKRGTLLLEDVHYIDAAISDQLPRSKLSAGDVAMTYIGVNIGDVALVPTSGRFHLGPNVAKITAKSARLHPNYLLSYLAHDGVKRSYLGLSTNTAKAALNMGKIRSIPLVVPSKNTQEEFAAVAQSTARSMQTQLAHLAELDALFASLQSRAFRGEL